MACVSASVAIAAGGCHGGAAGATDATAADAAALDARNPADAAVLDAPPDGPPPTACTDGTPSDFAGYTALCEGTYVFYDTAGPGTTIGPSPYTYAFVFGSAWPGIHTGYTEAFTLPVGRYLSIPFTPSPAHTVVFTDDSTYTPDNSDIFSVSTAPGLFNGGSANGTTVLCVGKSTPSLAVSSNGATGVNCVIPDMNRTYWLNMLPGLVLNGTFTGCTGIKTGSGGTTMFKCAVALSEQVPN